METRTLTIGELAEAAGISRRAVRFYVQRGLLHPPQGKGRGSAYDRSHLERLRRIQALQQAGHPLEAIAKILETGQRPPSPPSSERRPPSRSTLTAELWTRLRLLDGVELHLDATRFNPDAEDLLRIRDFVRSRLRGGEEPADAADPDAADDEEPQPGQGPEKGGSR